ncbi:hypothetical protein OC861_006164 [Tilletia horrida]|nr:hypothetical protein OC861_006164 [Tilletia horrida]
MKITAITSLLVFGAVATALQGLPRENQDVLKFCNGGACSIDKQKTLGISNEAFYGWQYQCVSKCGQLVTTSVSALSSGIIAVDAATTAAAAAEILAPAALATKPLAGPEQTRPVHKACLLLLPLPHPAPASLPLAFMAPTSILSSLSLICSLSNKFILARLLFPTGL